MEKIGLKNFRCYANQSISFKPSINLLIGDNATGKTSVLKACKYVLSAFFCGFSDENTKWVSPDTDDFRHITVNDLLSQELSIHLSFDIEDTIKYPELLGLRQTTFPELNTDPFDNCKYFLTKRSKKNSKPLTSGIKEYRDYATLLQFNYFNQDGQQKALPLFAYFSTEDIHSTRKIESGKFKSYNHKPSFGYYECLEGDGFFSYWVKRLLILQEGRENHPEIAIVRRAIGDALGKNGCNIIYDMKVRPIQKKVYYIFSDGREVEANLLSDGYKRLVNIVTDIAFRCALLNRGFYGMETTMQTYGTVLIDEVDLHLHPTLQATVLKGLRNAFPNIQFIVTTHAPMVMTGVESNEENIVYNLSYSSSEGYRIEEIETYGMDVSTITYIILNQIPREPQVQQQLDSLFKLIEDNKKEEARILLNEMRTKRGYSLPELTEAETMLNFSIEDDEADSER